MIAIGSHQLRPPAKVPPAPPQAQTIRVDPDEDIVTKVDDKK